MNQDRLDHLKQEYDAIPVPPELEERVRAAIRQARPAGEKPPRVLRLDRFLRRTGLSAAAAMLAVVLLANSGPGIAHAMEQVPVLGPSPVCSPSAPMRKTGATPPPTSTFPRWRGAGTR